MPKKKHRNPDHVQRTNAPSQNNEAIASLLEALLTPAIWAQQGYYRQLGMRFAYTQLVTDGSSSFNERCGGKLWECKS